VWKNSIFDHFCFQFLIHQRKLCEIVSKFNWISRESAGNFAQKSENCEKSEGKKKVIKEKRTQMKVRTNTGMCHFYRPMLSGNLPSTPECSRKTCPAPIYTWENKLNSLRLHVVVHFSYTCVRSPFKVMILLLYMYEFVCMTLYTQLSIHASPPLPSLELYMYNLSFFFFFFFFSFFLGFKGRFKFMYGKKGQLACLLLAFSIVSHLYVFILFF
jgi:hypothetical protein